MAFPEGQQAMPTQRALSGALMQMAVWFLPSAAFIVSGVATAINWKLGYDYAGEDQLSGDDFVMLAVAGGALVLGLTTLVVGVVCSTSERRAANTASD